MARKNNDQKGNIPVIEVVSKLMKQNGILISIWLNKQKA
jgi:hypothetical protein